MEKSVTDILQQNLLPEHAMDPTVWSFIIAYLETRHTGDAAKIAKISKHSGLRILQKADVQLALREIYAQMSRSNAFDAKEILERANEVAQINPHDIFNDDGTVKDIHDIPPSVARAIKRLVVKETWEKDENGIELKTGRIVSIEFWDKLKATELLGKYEGVFKEKVEHTHDIGKDFAKVLLAQAETRALESSRAVVEINGRRDKDI